MHFDKQKQLPTSTALSHVEYSTKEQVLRVHYRTGSHRDFYDIPMEHYSGLITAASAGSYLHSFINPKHKIVERSNKMK